jgi:hypothetical protein
MEKVDVTLDCFSYPMPCALVGVNVEGKPNYLTVGWFKMINKYSSKEVFECS